jgi:hypothetical protein
MNAFRRRDMRQQSRLRRNIEAGTFNARLTIALKNDREGVHQPRYAFLNVVPGQDSG